MSRENLRRYYEPLPRKNKCQKCLGKFRNKGKFYAIYSKVKIGLMLKDNCDIPAFFLIGMVPKG
jgi:hypothetical protein